MIQQVLNFHEKKADGRSESRGPFDKDGQKGLAVVGVVFNEDIDSGLLSSQFIEPLLHLQKKGHQTRVLSFCKPWKLPTEKRINVTRIPIAIPAKVFMFNSLSFFLVTLFAFLYSVILVVYLQKNTIYIARSYFPAYSFSILKFFVPSLEFIFDPRSLFIDENIGTGKIKDSGLNYKAWRRVEKFILRQAKKTIAVSKKQESHYRTIWPLGTILQIPCFASVDGSSDELGSGLCDKFNIPFEKVLICYYGSMNSSWNNIDIYRHFLGMNKCNGDYHFVFISQNYTDLLRINEFNQEHITLIPDAVLLEEKKNLMAACDYGLFLMAQNPDWESRLGVKFAQYCAQGLPVLLSPYVGEAVNYVNEHAVLSRRSRILDSSFVLPSISKVPGREKKRIQALAEKLFAYRNIERIFL